MVKTIFDDLREYLRWNPYSGKACPVDIDYIFSQLIRINPEDVSLIEECLHKGQAEALAQGKVSGGYGPALRKVSSWCVARPEVSE